MSSEPGLKYKKPKFFYLRDPHLYYHLQSPVKIKQLLQTGLYELDGNSLIEIQTQDALKISDFTMDKIPEEVKIKFARKDKKNKMVTEQNQRSMAHCKSINLAKMKQGVDQSQLLGNFSHVVQRTGGLERGQRMTDRKPNRIYLNPIQPSQYGLLKGLKQFRKKIL